MEEIDLKEIILMFWAKKMQILLVLLVAVMLGIIYTLNFVEPEYTSSTTLVLATSENSNTNSITTTDITLNSKLVSTYSELVKSNNVLRQVISNLGLNMSESALRSSITVSAVTNTELIDISVTTGNSTTSAQIANEVANVFMEKVTEIYNISNIHVVDTAKENDTPSNVNHLKDIIIFALGGLIIAFGYVILANVFDKTIKSEEEIEKQFNVSVLATIPLHNFDTSKKGGKKK